MKRSASDEEKRTYKREWNRRKNGVTAIRSLDRSPDARFDFYTFYAGDCIVWVGSCNKVTGYGQFNNGKTMMLAHRYAYERAFGKIPTGLQVDHLCRNRCCVNQAHLEAVTAAENIRRSPSLSTRLMQAKNRTNCINGHPYDQENLYISNDGRRRCKQCRVNARTKYNEKLKIITYGASEGEHGRQ